VRYSQESTHSSSFRGMLRLRDGHRRFCRHANWWYTRFLKRIGGNGKKKPQKKKLKNEKLKKLKIEKNFNKFSLQGFFFCSD